MNLPVMSVGESPGLCLPDLQTLGNKYCRISPTTAASAAAGEAVVQEDRLRSLRGHSSRERATVRFLDAMPCDPSAQSLCALHAFLRGVGERRSAPSAWADTNLSPEVLPAAPTSRPPKRRFTARSPRPHDFRQGGTVWLTGKTDWELSSLIMLSHVSEVGACWCQFLRAPSRSSTRRCSWRRGDSRCLGQRC